MEIDLFNLKPPLTNVSTPSSHFSSYLYHITSFTITNLPRRKEKSTDSQTGRNSEFLGKIGKNLPDAQCHFKADFGGLPLHQIRPKIACWKSLPI